MIRPESTSRIETPSESVLGVRIDAANPGRVIGTIADWIARGSRAYVCLAAAHSVMDGYRDRAVRAALNRSDLVAPDGMSLVWYLRARGHRHVRRVYGAELLTSTCEEGLGRGFGHFFYGGTQDVLHRLEHRLQSRLPGLKIVGSYAPPFRPLSELEEREVGRQIIVAQPDIIWVGIGSPRQEIWMAEHLGQLDVPVMIGVGAAFDFLSGSKPQAPSWMQRSGLEWLFRFAAEPRRLWRRYAEYPWFVFLVLAQLAGLMKFPIDD